MHAAWSICEEVVPVIIGNWPSLGCLSIGGSFLKGELSDLHYLLSLQTHTPDYLEWVKELSFASYGYSALVKNEFEGLELRSGEVMVVSDAMSAIPSNVESERRVGFNIGVLLCILAGLRFVGYIQMYFSIKLKLF